MARKSAFLTWFREQYGEPPGNARKAVQARIAAKLAYDRAREHSQMCFEYERAQQVALMAWTAATPSAK